jgi:hypothetical protein
MRLAAVLLVAALAAASPASADVVELRSGERVEGTFKGADETAVRIEVGGRVVTFSPDRVRAIYYGAPPAPAPAAGPERDEAIRALRALRSIARTGVAYPEYASRVGDAQTAVDRYVRSTDERPALRGAIADSMHYYALAGSARSASSSGGNYAAVGSDLALLRCGPAQQVIAESKRANPFIWRSKGAGEAATAGMVIGTGGLVALWSCASDRLADAERLVAEAPK